MKLKMKNLHNVNKILIPKKYISRSRINIQKKKNNASPQVVAIAWYAESQQNIGRLTLFFVVKAGNQERK